MQQSSYANDIINLQRVMILSLFILQENLEEQYLSYLNRLQINEELSDFSLVIQETIEEYK
ncbi:hypothetical protein ACFFHH_20220 [Cytobacillus solani]|uniref:hypothetical protein n=1 Tax=Cytobacillus solani TaxID=1637975 RepID=UPI0011506830|nr:hypothetical protein [Cytobacillus solani]